MAARVTWPTGVWVIYLSETQFSYDSVVVVAFSQPKNCTKSNYGNENCLHKQLQAFDAVMRWFFQTYTELYHKRVTEPL